MLIGRRESTHVTTAHHMTQWPDAGSPSPGCVPCDHRDPCGHCIMCAPCGHCRLRTGNSARKSPSRMQHETQPYLSVVPLCVSYRHITSLCCSCLTQDPVWQSQRILVRGEPLIGHWICWRVITTSVQWCSRKLIRKWHKVVKCLYAIICSCFVWD